MLGNINYKPLDPINEIMTMILILVSYEIPIIQNQV